MTELEKLVSAKINRSINSDYDKDLISHNAIHSIYISCLIHKYDPVKCSKMFLARRPHSYKVILETLKEFPEFNQQEIKSELDKLLVLL